MGKKEFDDFLQQLTQKKSNIKKIDWEAEKKYWLEYIEQFYKMVEGYLNDYVTTGKITLEYKKKYITEENIGTYETKELKIIINDNIATFTPIGTLLIGTKGRIDLSSKHGIVRFILADKDSFGPKIEVNVFYTDEERKIFEEKQKTLQKKEINWTWKIASEPPIVKYIDLNQDSFFDVLLDIING